MVISRLANSPSGKPGPPSAELRAARMPNHAIRMVAKSRKRWLPSETNMSPSRVRRLRTEPVIEAKGSMLGIFGRWSLVVSRWSGRQSLVVGPAFALRARRTESGGTEVPPYEIQGHEYRVRLKPDTTDT